VRTVKARGGEPLAWEELVETVKLSVRPRLHASYADVTRAVDRLIDRGYLSRALLCRQPAVAYVEEAPALALQLPGLQLQERRPLVSDPWRHVTRVLQLQEYPPLIPEAMLFTRIEEKLLGRREVEVVPLGTGTRGEARCEEVVRHVLLLTRQALYDECSALLKLAGRDASRLPRPPEAGWGSVRPLLRLWLPQTPLDLIPQLARESIPRGGRPSLSGRLSVSGLVGRLSRVEPRELTPERFPDTLMRELLDPTLDIRNLENAATLRELVTTVAEVFASTVGKAASVMAGGDEGAWARGSPVVQPVTYFPPDDPYVASLRAKVVEVLGLVDCELKPSDLASPVVEEQGVTAEVMAVGGGKGGLSAQASGEGEGEGEGRVMSTESADSMEVERSLSTSLTGASLLHRLPSAGLPPDAHGTVMQGPWCFAEEEEALAQAVGGLEAQVATVAEMFGIHRDVAWLAMQTQDWNVEAAVEALLVRAKRVGGLSSDLGSSVFAPVTATDGGDLLECPLCRCPAGVGETRRLRECGHRMCADCLRHHAVAEIERRDGLPVRCPFQGEGCRALLPAGACDLDGDLRASGLVAVLVWPLPRQASGEKVEELQGTVRAALASERVEAREVRVGVGDATESLDFAVITLTAEVARRLVALCGAKAVSVFGRPLLARVGGWGAAHERAAMRRYSSTLFTHCKNPKGCRGLVCTGKGGGWEGTQALRCRLCAAEMCPKCDFAHVPASCKMMAAWAAKDGVVARDPNDVDSRALIAKITKNCPSCATPIEKNEGR
jgi:hypothetical protein